MADPKGTAMVKRRNNYLRLITVFPEREQFYLDQIEELNNKIVLAGVCRRCGRPLKDEDARRIGYGKECQGKAEAEASEDSS